MFEDLNNVKYEVVVMFLLHRAHLVSAKVKGPVWPHSMLSEGSCSSWQTFMLSCCEINIICVGRGLGCPVFCSLELRHYVATQTGMLESVCSCQRYQPVTRSTSLDLQLDRQEWKLSNFIIIFGKCSGLPNITSQKLFKKGYCVLFKVAYLSSCNIK